MLWGLAKISAGNSDADVTPVTEFGQRTERIGDIEWIMEVRHHNRRADLDWYL